jgi:DNA-binding Lrp family transcriptional regulator
VTERNKASVDATDARILEALLQHPRSSAVSLADQLGLARSTVQIRLTKLENIGLLSLDGALAVPALAGYGVTGFMTIEVRQQDLSALKQALARIPEVIEAYGTTGAGDVLCRVVAKSAEDLGRVNSLVLESPGVQRASTAVVIRPVLDFRLAPLLSAVKTSG